MVRVQMLGRPGVEDRGEWRELPRGKTSALLYYLAYREAWVSRDEIVYLFWPDSPDPVARGNLRSLLSRNLRRQPFTVPPEIEPERLRWPVASDVAEFRAAVRTRRWRSAFESHGGELLAGYPCDAIPQFATWLGFEREALQRDYLEAGVQHARELERRGDGAAAERVLEALLAVRPDDEELFRRYLRFLERSGRSERAPWAFARFRQQLAHELDAEPDAVTVRLLERIQRRAAPPAARPAHNLPSGLTPFVGRREERLAVTRQLLEPECRLLTILAPGGMGKTRLALACARELLESYPDGAWFVPLDAARDRPDLAHRIADAAGLVLRGRAAPEAQLRDHFAPRRALLVLDTAEEVLAEARTVAALLRAAPGTDVLTTSRARLHLPGEHVFELSGLRMPTAEVPPEAAAGYDAVHLFYRCARQGGRPLPASSAHVETVAEICRRVGGMPLAIELAAAWLRLLPPGEILRELRRGTGILSRAQADGDDRHRSIEAVFDATWRMLRVNEQRALARTTVFRGGFDRDAALAVTGAGLPLLAALADRALLRVSPGGRYLRHPLLQQYLRERFAASSALDGARERHAVHYLARLDRFGEDAAPFPAADLENLDAAWRHAVAARRPDLLRGRARALARAFASRTGTAAELLEAGLDVLPDAAEETRAPLELELLSTLVSARIATHGFASPRLRRATARLDALTRDDAGGPERAPALWCLWAIHFHDADHDAARRTTERMFALAAAHDDPDVALQARHAAWTFAFALGAFDEVVRHAAIDDLYDPERHPRQLSLFGGHDARVCAENFAGIAEWALGRDATGLERHRRGVAHAERLDHPFSLMLACLRCAVLHCLRRDPDEAARFAERTLEMAERHRFPLGIALGTLCRGWSRGQRDPDAALPEMDDALGYWRDKRRDFDYLMALALRAEVDLRAERFGAAATALDEALAIVRAYGWRYHLPEILRLRGELTARRGDTDDRVLRAFHAARRAAEAQGARVLRLRAAASLQRWHPSLRHRRELARCLDAMPEAPGPLDLAAVRTLLEPN